MVAYELRFVAPIPAGHRVQVLRVQRWTSPLFGGPAAWEDTANPIVVDLDTGVVYTDTYQSQHLVPSPLAFKPNTGFQVSGMTEGRVVGCIVGSDGGDHTSLHTHLFIEPAQAQGAYR